MAISQKNRPIRVSTVLGEDVLLFYQMHGTEKLGELFEYELELLSENTTSIRTRCLARTSLSACRCPTASGATSTATWPASASTRRWTALPSTTPRCAPGCGF